MSSPQEFSFSYGSLHMDAIRAFFSTFSDGTPTVSTTESAAGEFVLNMGKVQADEVEILNRLHKSSRGPTSPHLIEVVSEHINQRSARELFINSVLITAFLHLSVLSALHKDILYACKDIVAFKVLEVIEELLISAHSHDFSEPFTRNMHRVRRKLSLITSSIPPSLFVYGIRLNDLSPVAGGSYGNVYDASYNGVRVAMKLLRGLSARHEFLKEALQWASLNHPNVLEFIGVDNDTFQWPSMISPWMPYGNIRDAMQSLCDCCQIAYRELWTGQAASGMEYLHSQNLIHGDFRGENVLVDVLFNIRIADFGLSFFQDDGSGIMGSHPGGAMRSLAPELFVQDIRPTFASDVYAFAFLCIEIWTGRIPFPEYTHWKVVFLVTGRIRPERPETLHNDALWILIQECWVANPQERPDFPEISARIQSFSLPSRSPSPRDLIRPETPLSNLTTFTYGPTSSSQLEDNPLPTIPQAALVLSDSSTWKALVEHGSICS